MHMHMRPEAQALPARDMVTRGVRVSISQQAVAVLATMSWSIGAEVLFSGGVGRSSAVLLGQHVHA